MTGEFLKSLPACKSHFHLAVLVFTVAFTGCSTTGQNAFSSPFVVERMYFGRNIDSTSSVSDSSWTVFLGTSVTPRFPNGFTFWRAEGQWRRADGALVHEQSFVLEIIHAADANDAETAIGRMIDEYKRAFRQESVLRVVTPAKARF